MAEAVETLSNFVGGRWIPATATGFVDVHNPARGTVIAGASLRQTAPHGWIYEHGTKV